MIFTGGARERLCRTELFFILAVYSAWTVVSFCPQPTNPTSKLVSESASFSPSVTKRQSLRLFVGNKKNLSASDQERRDEENRRRKRKDDVVVGKTSAKRGETDYQLDPKGTEEKWLSQASKVEQEIFRLTEIGMESLKGVC